ncbi:uncharacterized protein LOC117654110 isoform X2 [Thrips palmi]|uniref:Uncharacterized protein LOC117654110 isoform X2 n=1 Tax=Thrips palmi TaxID=161013 RepID=A0A6P9AD75_THRPL|nr:uncharacterized protein LOC117654110 isoform X2 [Thrips palmi]
MSPDVAITDAGGHPPMHRVLLTHRYAVSAGSQVGDNYLGVLFRVVVTEDGDDDKPGLRLILKGMPLSAKRREQMQVGSFFDNEFHAYRTVLPALARFLADKAVDDVKEPGLFPNTARCHEASSGGEEGQDTLVLEDMRPLGFTMHDRRVGLDEHHVRAVFKSLSFLHAASMAMEAQRPKDFAKIRDLFTETLFDSNNPIMAHVEEILKRTYVYIADRHPEGSEMYAKVKAFIDGYGCTMERLVSRTATGNAISHGDCWTNNLLFKYKKPGVVEDVCLLDFQLSRHSTPVLDLVYLVYTCTVREWRRQHLKAMFKEYHDMLSENIRRLGSDPDELYSWETFQAHLRERGVFGLGMALMTIPVFLAEAEEIPDLDESFESGKSPSEVFDVESKSSPERNKRICDVIEEMVEQGWL